MALKVLVTSNSFGKYSGEPQKKLEEAGFEVILNPYHRMMNEEEFIKCLSDVDAVILSTEKVTKKVIDSSPKLKMISRYGVGLDNVDLEYCKEKGIPVTVTKGGNSNAVAEFAVSLMLSCLRGVASANQYAKQNIWKKFTGLDLDGKTIGVVGLGAIGKLVIKKLQGFDVKILGYDVYYDEEFVKKYSVEKVSIDDLVKNSDIITLHAPSNGKAILGKEEFKKMKDNVVIVNTARSDLIDLDALLEAIKNNKVFAAGLDVHENEPNFDIRFEGLDNVILTPHQAAISKEASNKASQMAVDNILNYFGKENMK
ncbi:phosphoglycerate dehydrogenase [uncultured Faecalicoccus sp.]|uniref:phosphoglycerate dehydrogenase n=1 Tax=uncultured Faecalicoccus sp. TaxID=1971760 RepID=UPI00258F3F2A|nr:phosphoglycerate dehydrogenase [uncultured Faecalicoccus sp.]